MKNKQTKSTGLYRLSAKGKIEIKFYDFNYPTNRLDKGDFDVIIKTCKDLDIIVTKKQLELSHEMWKADCKSYILLPNHYWLYHACGCNSLFFEFYFDDNKKMVEKKEQLIAI